jgi:hypothetical protein
MRNGLVVRIPEDVVPHDTLLHTALVKRTRARGGQLNVDELIGFINGGISLVRDNSGQPDVFSTALERDERTKLLAALEALCEACHGSATWVTSEVGSFVPSCQQTEATT